MTNSPHSPPTPAAWLLRLLMATLLLFGAEILLWNNPQGRAIGEWGVLAAGYLALGALLLDLAARYGIRTLYDAMTLIALYALFAGLILNPQTALADFPRTFLTRVIGAYSLLGLEMFGVFLALTGGTDRRALRLLVGFSVWVGFYWGLWVRWSPSLSGWITEEIALEAMAVSAGGMLALALVLAWLAARMAARWGRTLAAADLRLPPAQFAGMLGILAVIFAARVFHAHIAPGAVALGGAIGLLCAAILWFQRPTKGAILLDAHLPPTLPSTVWLASALAVFALSTVLAYRLPLLDLNGYNQLSMMEYGFAGVGLVWLPIVAAVVSVNALDRIGRQRRS